MRLLDDSNNHVEVSFEMAHKSYKIDSYWLLITYASEQKYRPYNLTTTISHDEIYFEDQVITSAVSC